MRPLTFAAVVGSIALLTCGNAGALPGASVKGATDASKLLLVRDGCGRGMRFSNRMQACVEDIEDGYRQGPPLRYDQGPPLRYYQDPPLRYDGEENYRRAPPPQPIIPACPPGQRFS